MSTHLELHHVGEVVLRGLLERLAERQGLDAVRCMLHDRCNLSAVLDHAGVEQPLRFEVNAPLAPIELAGENVLFDGAHGVDVLCHDQTRGLGIEAKLGRALLSSSSFTERFLEPLKLSSHRPPRVRGSMTAILNYRSVGDAALHLRTSAPALELVAPWFLVVRAATWRGWGAKPPALSNAHVAVFEEIAAAHGDAGEFDRLVLDQVGKGFHAAWKVFE